MKDQSTPAKLDMAFLIRQSNLVENIDDPAEDKRSLKAWQFIEDQPAITQSLLLMLHKLITLSQLSEKEAGHFRRVDVSVGRHKAPPPVVAFYQIVDWLSDFDRKWRELDPQAMHVRFEKIHPFVDGNGRTGRMLMWWHELKLGLEPTPILLKERQQYYGWFR